MSATAIKLLSVKELAAELGRSTKYVRQMKKRGFKMPGKRGTVDSALKWLDSNPPPFGA